MALAIIDYQIPTIQKYLHSCTTQLQPSCFGGTKHASVTSDTDKSISKVKQSNESRLVAL